MICKDCGFDKPLTEFPGGKPHSYCKRCNNVRNRASVKRLYGDSRHYHLRERFGLSEVEVDRMIRDQDGVCAICKERPATDVDHDHSSGRVRGMLCAQCNSGLGALKDDPKLIWAAIDYLDPVPVEELIQ